MGARSKSRRTGNAKVAERRPKLTDSQKLRKARYQNEKLRKELKALGHHCDVIEKLRLQHSRWIHELRTTGDGMANACLNASVPALKAWADLWRDHATKGPGPEFYRTPDHLFGTSSHGRAGTVL
jgi:hypothetical protein